MDASSASRNLKLKDTLLVPKDLIKHNNAINMKLDRQDHEGTLKKLFDSLFLSV